MTKKCSSKARGLIADAHESPLYIDGELAPAFLAIEEYIADLEEAVYGPRDMTRDETPECMIKRLREERDHYRANSQSQALIEAVQAFLKSGSSCPHKNTTQTFCRSCEEYDDAKRVLADRMTAIDGVRR